MKAAPAQQQELLRLQDRDIALTQLAHKLRALPQTKALADLAAADDVLRRETTAPLGELDDARAELGRIESDVAVVEARITRDESRLQLVTNPKDAVGLESELESLRRRLSELEDNELVVMERIEEGEAGVAAIEAKRAELAAQRTALAEERDQAAGVLAVEQENAERDRGIVASGIDADLLALYERHRAAGGGIGAALLRQRACGGCTMTLTGTDLDRVRKAAADEVVLCPECDRILVRTEESGL
ncbi:zinc ribbon domain-containing protein [Agromyces seonyuensis]|uniref:C4-type zinc ribbon domain-containing protein n=1 Tax=Agromyces seonyuensis TaxID=2662446 RepID=A0A6I4P181_9MICO|nr:C4-type zinc ribbon domain-containing protein [Agromyces seonyuensis]MWB97779.1 hypothetical protein [Agromyces seonyuensis]